MAGDARKRGRRSQPHDTEPPGHNPFGEGWSLSPFRTPDYDPQARRYRHEGAEQERGRGRGLFGLPQAPEPISVSASSPQQLIQYVVDVKAASMNPFVGGTLSEKGVQMIAQRLGYLAGMGGQLDKPVHGSYEHPLEGTKKTYAPNPRAGVIALFEQTFPDHVGVARAAFDAGAARGTAARQEVSVALGELKPGLSHEQLAAVGHRLGKAVRALPAGAGQVLPLDQIAQGLRGVQGGEQMLAYLRASGTHTPQGMVNLTAATGYVADPAAQQILKEAFAAGAAGRPVLGERRIAQIEAKPAKVDTPAGRAIARMEQIKDQLKSGGPALTAESWIKLAHDFGMAARTPLLAAGRVALKGVGEQEMPDAMVAQMLKKEISAAIGRPIGDEAVAEFIAKLKENGKPITGAVLFERLAIGSLVPAEHRPAAIAALRAGLQGKPLPKPKPARTSELEVDAPPRLAELPDDARAQVAAVVASLDVTLTEARRPVHDLPEHLRADAGRTPAVAQG